MNEKTSVVTDKNRDTAKRDWLLLCGVQAFYWLTMTLHSSFLVFYLKKWIFNNHDSVIDFGNDGCKSVCAAFVGIYCRCISGYSENPNILLSGKYSYAFNSSSMDQIYVVNCCDKFGVCCF